MQFRPAKKTLIYHLISIIHQQIALQGCFGFVLNAKEIYAEFIGTFILVFAITAAIVGSVSLTATFGALNLLPVAFAAGLALAVLLYSLGPISGGHFNPAVTIGLIWAKKFPAAKGGAYIIAQILGAALASLLVWVIAPNAGLGTTTAGTFGTVSAVLMEIIATALFLIVILSVTAKKSDSSHAPLAIGFYLLAAHLFAIPFSGASLNPARSFGPALISVIFEPGPAMGQLWIYIVGPVAGALLGAWIYRKALEGK